MSENQLPLETVTKVASLARLALTSDELVDMQKDLNRVLQYVQRLESVDTSDVEPMAHPLEFTDVFRKDEVTESLPREEALKNAPQTDGQFFVVPNILDQK